jgi:2,4-dienoyl-CoA reductase-like NADH-dependent reductase (Old Yellow Enzyme family)
MKKTSILFSPVSIGSVEIPNRFVRSATHDFMADDEGRVRPEQIRMFRELAEGGVGLILTGHAYVNHEGKASLRQTGADADDKIEGLRLISEAVHKTQAKIFLQISHSGRQTKPKLCGCTPLAPSEVFEPTFKLTPRAMTEEDIRQTIADFSHAGRRAGDSGFDGLQIHIAHGYLLSSFISPYTNRRSDRWGGSLDNRLRIVREIMRGIRALTGPRFPLTAKLNATDFLEGGLTLEESTAIARILEDEGLDALEVSGGMSEAGQGSVWKGMRAEEEEGYFLRYAARIKKSLSIPVFGLGGLRTFSVMERAVSTGRVDMISLSRPFIQDPAFVKKFRTGVLKKSECISCNGCFNPRGISCAENRRRKKRKNTLNQDS